MFFMFVAIVCSILAVVSSETKCCGVNSEIFENKTLLQCVNRSDTRHHVVADSYDFLETNSSGKCVDFNGKDFFLYTVLEHEMKSKEPVLNSFPKCCPLNFVYNQTTHSCVNFNLSIELNITKFNVSKNFARDFIKIGLPKCNITRDLIVSDETHIVSYLKSAKKDTFCLDKTTTNDFVLRECQNSFKICEEKRCIKKCCPDGQSYVNGSSCLDTYIHGIDLEFQNFSPYIEDSSDDFNIINGASCGSVAVYYTNTIQYSITKKGIFRYYSNFSDSFIDEDVTNSMSYCIEHIDKKDRGLNGYYLLYCLEKKELNDKFRLTIAAKILSCIFLILTITLYVWLGETKSLFGKILINYCIAMFALMMTLLVTHTTYVSQIECKIRAYLLLYFAISTFTWVNVMSMDIWGTFGSSKQTVGQYDKSKSLRRLIFYLMYGWTLPILYIFLIMVLENTSFLPDIIQPRLGLLHCFFEKSNYGMLVFLNIPELLFQLVNTVLFIKTVICFIRIKNDINKMNDTSRNARLVGFKERLMLILKLGVIMGLMWIIEIITAFSQNMETYSNFTKNLEVILDNITCLQGIFIFLIFICKRKTYNSLMEKLGWKRQTESMSVTPTSEIISTNLAMSKKQGTKSENP